MFHSFTSIPIFRKSSKSRMPSLDLNGRHIPSVFAHLEVDIPTRLILGQRAQLVSNTDPIHDVRVLASLERLTQMVLSCKQDLHRWALFDRRTDQQPKIHQRIATEQVSQVAVDGRTMLRRLFAHESL